MTNADQFKFGEVTFPTTIDQTNTYLKDTDLSLYTVLKYLTSMIKYNLEERFIIEANKVGYKNNHDKTDGYFTNLVPTSIHYDPNQYLLANQYKFPILSIFRYKTVSIKDESFAYQMKKSIWKLYFILAPFDTKQAFSLTPVLNGIESVVARSLNRRHHPSYENDDLILDNAGIFDIELNENATDFGDFKITKSDKSNIIFPTWATELVVTERQNYVDELELAGVDIVQKVTDDQGSVTIIESEINV